MKKLIIINGVMGVGKTTICQSLYKRLENCFWLDGDNCWMMHPFKVSIENQKMVLKNICFLINNFLRNSQSQYVLFNWVIHTDSIMNDILSGIDLRDASVYKITLMCSKEALVERIKKDINDGKRSEDSIQRSIERLKMYNDMSTIKLDTTNLTIDEVIKSIKEIVR